MDTVDKLIHKQLDDVLRHTKTLQELQKLFDSTVDNFFKNHLQVANFSDDCLTVIADNASIATRLRFIEPDIISKLKHCSELQQLKKIKCKVRPSNKKEEVERKVERKISNASAELIKQTAEHIKDEKIRKALEHLISK